MLTNKLPTTYRERVSINLNSIFQQYPAVLDNAGRIDVFSIAENDETTEFIHDIIGINFQSFDMAFSAKYGLRRLSSLVENYIDLHLKYNEPFEEYIDFNPFGENSKFYSISHNFIIDLKIACGNRYGQSWKGLYNAFIKPYDVLSPYNVKINEDSTDTLKSKNAYVGEGTDKNDSNFTTDNSENRQDGLYGFNSTRSVPSDTTRHSSNEKNVGTEDRKSTSRSDTDYNRDVVYNRLLVREGNIGNQSAPELIEKEISLRRRLLWDIVTEDLAELLTRQKYN